MSARYIKNALNALPFTLLTYCNILTDKLPISIVFRLSQHAQWCSISVQVDLKPLTQVPKAAAATSFHHGGFIKYLKTKLQKKGIVYLTGYFSSKPSVLLDRLYKKRAVANLTYFLI